MNKKLQTLKYILVDIFSAEIVWFIFFIYRQSMLDNNLLYNFSSIFGEDVFWLGFVLYPLFWNFLYIIAGMYRRVYRKTRLIELKETASFALIGVFILFFVLILEDPVFLKTNQTKLFLVFLLSQFLLTYLGRWLITHRTIKKIHARKIGFNTILIGTSGNAIKVFNDLENQRYSSGNKFIGFVDAKKLDKYKIASVLPHLGSIASLPKLIDEYAIEEVVIAIEKSESNMVATIITELELFDVVIKALNV
jgi:FlaA1/EpsC-like NDP-sugar epimerase